MTIKTMTVAESMHKLFADDWDYTMSEHPEFALDAWDGDWREIARRGPWQATRMNLNTFARQGVFGAEDRPQTKEEKQVTRIVADRLRDGAVIRKARVMPYQLLAAWANTESRVPGEVR